MKNAINTILQSASKLVFVLMALSVVVAMFFNKITGEQFMLLAGMTFTFYFSHKGDKNKPYAGK